VSPRSLRAGPAEARRLFLPALALVYLVAFASLATQITGLVGERGLLPVGEFLGRARDAYGTGAYRLFPTLLWFSHTDAILSLLCWSGVAVSLLLLAGVVPIASAFVLWALYLSLTIAGQTFLQFQWDALLLETGLLAILYAPPVWWSRPGTDIAPPTVVRWVLWGLAFKVTFLSGITKLLSGDPTWANLTALRYHYETQPLPMWTGWFLHQIPPFVQTCSAAGMFFVELVVPWVVFLPTRWRRARLIGCALMIALQLGIAATGNYGFFNLLTIALYLAVLDDNKSGGSVGRVPPSTAAMRPFDFAQGVPSIVEGRGGPAGWRLFANGAAVVIALLSAMTFFREIDLTWGRSSPLERLWSTRALAWTEPFNSISGYGLFRVMTTERPEIVIEVSEDGVTWKEQEFRWKPGDLKRRPAVVQPHMPRLDWQMWFAALDPASAQEWLRPLTLRLLNHERLVVDLLAPSPLQGEPKFARLAYYRYHFTSRQERAEIGAWWKREFVGYLTDVIRRSDQRRP
jgi:lipase maturation factor 1